MGVLLSKGLQDQSGELGETTTVTSALRIRTYNDAVQDFANEKKWPFLVKENSAKSTVVGDNEIDVSDILDMRNPGPIKEIYLGTDTEPYTPIDWENRNDTRYSSGKYCYITPDNQTIVLKGSVTSVQTVHLWYYYIPARIETIATPEVLTFPIPDRYRKVVATLAAAYVQWSRYLDAQGNRLYNMYERMLGKTVYQQSERNAGQPRKLKHYLQHIGFRRTYPR